MEFLAQLLSNNVVAINEMLKEMLVIKDLKNEFERIVIQKILRNESE